MTVANFVNILSKELQKDDLKASKTMPAWLVPEKPRQPRQRPRYQLAEQLLDTLDPFPSKVLDVGGGALEMAQRLKQRGSQVTILDIDPRNVERAKELGYQAECVDLNHGLGSAAGEKYPLVVMLEVVEHVVRAENLVREIHKVIEPWGHLLLSTPNFSYYLNRLRILLGRPLPEEGYHLRFFNKKTLNQLLRRNGFNILARRSFGPVPIYAHLRQLMLKKPGPFVPVPERLESLLASTLMVLAQKQNMHSQILNGMPK